MESEGYTAILCLTFLGTVELFSTAAALFYTPTNNVQEFQFLCHLTNTSYSHPSEWEVIPYCGLIHIPQMTNVVKILFIC